MAGGSYSADFLLRLLGEVAKGSPYRGDDMLRHLFENEGRPLMDAYGEPIRTRDDTPNLAKDVGRDYMRLVVNEDPYKYVKRTKRAPGGKSYADVLDEQSSWFNERAYATALQTVLGSFPDAGNRANKIDKIAGEMDRLGIERDDLSRALERCRAAGPREAAETVLGLGRLLFSCAERRATGEPGETSSDSPSSAMPALTLRALLARLADAPDAPFGARGWSEAEALDALLPDAVLRLGLADAGLLERTLTGRLSAEERTRAHDAILSSGGLSVRRWRTQLATILALDADATWGLLASLRAGAGAALAPSLATIARQADGDAALALELLLALAILGPDAFEPLARGVRAYL